MEARLSVSMVKRARQAVDQIVGPMLVPPKYTEFRFTLDVNDVDYEDPAFRLVVVLELNKGKAWEEIGTITFDGGTRERYGVKNPPWVAGCRTGELSQGDWSGFAGFNVRARVTPNRPAVIGADFSMT